MRSRRTDPTATCAIRNTMALSWVMLGFLVQRPTLLTLAMFPILTLMYVKLAKTEERESVAEFGTAYTAYAKDVPGFIPRLTRVFGQSPAEGFRHGR
jgi:methanethiol S-methyltransferase